MPTFIESGFTTRVEYEKFLASGGAGAPDGEYVLFYWGKCAGFWGRAFGAVCMLEQAGASYVVRQLVSTVPSLSALRADPA